MSIFSEQQKALRNRAFTEGFLNKTITLSSNDLDDLQTEVDYLNIYKDGGIMGVALDLNAHNRKILSQYIKDFEAYNELIDLEYSSEKKEGQTDLISLIDYSDNEHGVRILYDVDHEYFYNEGYEE